MVVTYSVNCLFNYRVYIYSCSKFILEKPIYLFCKNATDLQSTYVIYILKPNVVSI